MSDDRARPREAPALPGAAAIGGFEDVATIELKLDDVSVRVLTIDEVIASKEELARPKDRAALPALYATREAIQGRRRRQSEGPGAGPAPRP